MQSVEEFVHNLLLNCYFLQLAQLVTHWTTGLQLVALFMDSDIPVSYMYVYSNGTLVSYVYSNGTPVSYVYCNVTKMNKNGQQFLVSLARALYNHLEWHYHGNPWPSVSVGAVELVYHLTRRINEASVGRVGVVP